MHLKGNTDMLSLRILYVKSIQFQVDRFKLFCLNCKSGLWVVVLVCVSTCVCV